MTRFDVIYHGHKKSVYGRDTGYDFLAYGEGFLFSLSLSSVKRITWKGNAGEFYGRNGRTSSIFYVLIYPCQ